MDALKDKVILVTGATGRQGSAAVRHLLEAGFPIRALTREREQPEAKRLEELGAELVEGDLGQPDRVRRGLSGDYEGFADLTRR